MKLYDFWCLADHWERLVNLLSSVGVDCNSLEMQLIGYKMFGSSTDTVEHLHWRFQSFGYLSSFSGQWSQSTSCGYLWSGCEWVWEPDMGWLSCHTQCLQQTIVGWDIILRKSESNCFILCANYKDITQLQISFSLLGQLTWHYSEWSCGQQNGHM